MRKVLLLLPTPGLLRASTAVRPRRKLRRSFRREHLTDTGAFAHLQTRFQLRAW